MKLLIISDALPPLKAGEADHTLHLGRNFAAHGCEVHVLASEKYAEAKDLPFTLHPVMRTWSWSDMGLFVRFLKTCRPDAILFMYTSWIYNCQPMITFAPTLAARALPGVPFITQVEALSNVKLPYRPAPLPRLLDRTVRLWARVKPDTEYGTLLRDSKRVIVLSEKFCDALAAEYPGIREKALVIPPPPILHLAPDTAESRKNGQEFLGVGEDEFLLVCYGYVMPSKGVETLLSALAGLETGSRRVRLAIVGGVLREYPSNPAFADEVTDLPRRLGIEDRVVWRGDYPADSDLGSLCLRAADACVLPFDDGVVLNRSSFAAAVSHSLPVITTRGATLEDPFVDGENVLLCPPKDPAALAAAIRRVVAEEDLRGRLGQGARKLAHDWFSWDTAVERTLAAFRGGDGA